MIKFKKINSQLKEKQVTKKLIYFLNMVNFIVSSFLIPSNFSERIIGITVIYGRLPTNYSIITLRCIFDVRAFNIIIVRTLFNPVR